jgi:uncharacterized membrane protein
MADARTLQAADHRRLLVPANLLLVGLLVIHALDHSLRQDASVPAAGQTLGIVGFVAALGSLGLAAAASRRAPIATAVVGFSTAVGFVAVHVLPNWGPFSQPYENLGVDAVSWIGMLIPLLGAALVGGIGLRAARTGPTK